MTLNGKILLIESIAIILSFVTVGLNYKNTPTGDSTAHIGILILVVGFIHVIAQLLKAYLNAHQPEPATKEDVNRATNGAANRVIDTFEETLDHPATPLVMVPYPQNTFLKNGDVWIAKIREEFSKGYQAAVCQAATVGQGGIGKTAMAVEYAWKYSGEYPGGVFWLGMETGLAGAVSNFLQEAEAKKNH